MLRNASVRFHLVTDERSPDLPQVVERYTPRGRDAVSGSLDYDELINH